MENYRKSSHCTYDIKYHLVWITKYRKPVQYIKGNTSGKLQMEYKELNGQFQGQHLWARGYFVASSGNVTDEIIKEYIKNQDIQEKSNYCLRCILSCIPKFGNSCIILHMSVDWF